MLLMAKEKQWTAIAVTNASCKCSFVAWGETTGAHHSGTSCGGGSDGEGALQY